MKSQQVLSFLRQWAWLILLGTAVAAATAYLTSQRLTPVYEATAVWLVDEPANSETTAATTSAAQTYAALALTQPVLAETIERLDLPFSTAQLGTMVTAVAPDNTHLIHIRAQDSDSGRAALIANTIGAVLADQSAARESERFAAPLANWQQQIDESSTEIEALKSQLAAENVTNRTQLESNLAEAQDRYDAAVVQLNDLLTQQAAEAIIITPVETAQATAVPIRPRTAAATLWAAASGALAALVIVSFWGRIKDEEPAAVVDTAVAPAIQPAASND